MATKIQLRRGTAAQWTATNPVLAQGEVGVELATGKWKVGDGATAWNSLAYAGLQLAGDLGGTAAAPTVTGLHLSSPMSQANGGTGAAALGDATFTPTGEGSPRALDDVAASTLAYDVPFACSYTPTAGEEIFRIPFARTVNFAAGLATSRITPPRVAPTAQAVFSIKKNGTEEVATLTCDTDSSMHLAAAADFHYDPGDWLSVVAPAVADATLAGFGVVLAGTL